jgi:hypothetical protein
MRPRGMHAKVSPEELEKIKELKKTIPARQVARMMGRSMLVVVYADKPRPSLKKKEELFDYKQRENWLL